ncbi:MAG: acylphosphatase [Candidatus Paceibacteria bacterium]
MIEMHGTITGKVQGVRYRDFVQVSAGTLGVVGYVENRLDGTVLVVAQGWPEVLKEFVEYLHEGSLQAEVEGVAVEWRSVSGNYEDFSIRHV